MGPLSEQFGSGHVIEAVIHLNHARDISSEHGSRVTVARTLFDALNKLQTDWVLRQSDQPIGEVKAFQRMIQDGLAGEARIALLHSSELASLVSLQPQVLNHDILRRREYRPDVSIDPSLAHEASEVHRRLVNAYRDAERNGEAEERVLKRATELLYVVRSNIAHGEKTPYGPDISKRTRDEQVCSVIVPLVELMLELLLDRPSFKLIAYGTLAPGQSNHGVVRDLVGSWSPCLVRGSLQLREGLPVFSWDPSDPHISAQLCISSRLPELWFRIDAFEGTAYRRHLVPTELVNGSTIANVYIGNEK